MSSTDPKPHNDCPSGDRSSGYVSRLSSPSLRSVTVVGKPVPKVSGTESEEILQKAVKVKLIKRRSKRLQTRIVIDIGAEKLEQPVLNVFIHGSGSARIHIIKSVDKQIIDVRDESSAQSSEA